MTPRLRSTSAILGAFAISLGVYVASLRGDLSFWDTGDLQTVPYILGIPYPTGFPGFVLAGWVWTHVIPFGNVAWRMNLLAGVASAGTVAALVAALLTAGIGEVVALGAAAIFAFANLPWNHATYIDVHPVSFCAVAWGLVAALRWRRSGSLRDAAALLAAVVVALAFDNTTVLMLPGIALVALTRRPPLGASLRASAVALLALAAVYAYLPIRSALVTAWRLDPTLALGIPPGRPFWDDGHPASLDGFLRVVTGSRFSPHRAVFSMLGTVAFTRLATDFTPLARRDLGEPVLWLAVFGAALWGRRAPALLIGLVAFGVVPVLFIFAYPSESDTSRYFLAAYFVLAAFAAYGAHAFAALPRVPRAAAGIAGAIMLVTLLVGDYGQTSPLFSQPTDPGASLFVNRLRLLTQRNAIVVAPWLYATSLGYAAYVDHALDGRTVVTADSDEYTAKYRDWLTTRPVVVVSDDVPHLRGFTLDELDHGSPHIYALR
jgi:hypothetical protein